MTIEILFQEVCGLYGDSQNPVYLQATLPNAEFIFTTLTDTPYFVNNDPDLIYIGCMSESVQRRVITKLLPYRDRILQLVEKGIPILATGNAGEIFAKSIKYVTEGIEIDALGLFDLYVETDLFKRHNSMVLAQLENIQIVGFRSQFSFIYGDNTSCGFANCIRGIGINPKSKIEGMRKNNLICTQLLGPILPLNPLFCEYLLRLAGNDAPAAFRDSAMDAYQKRLEEFRDPHIAF